MKFPSPKVFNTDITELVRGKNVQVMESTVEERLYYVHIF